MAKPAMGRALRLFALLASFVMSCTITVPGGDAGGTATVSADAAGPIGTFDTQLGTQFHYPGSFDRAPLTRPLFRALGAPLVRILAAADGCCWPGGPSPMIPAGKVKGSWDFSSLDSVVNEITTAGAQPVLDIFQAPEWMWRCPAGTIVDPTFGEFGDYMARLVGYYNKGSFVAEDGSTIANPAGLANRITYWELWNEPDWWSIACPPKGNPNITARQYLTMWNTTAPRMLAVDPSIKLVGPSVASASGNNSGNYIALLMAGATPKPDVVSFHGYGGWIDSQSDAFLFGGGCCGIDAIARNLESVQTWAPGIPVWITELNVNADWGDDPTHRPNNAYGAAWGASAFRRLALGGVAALFQFEFGDTGNANFQMVDPQTSQPRLPYWRDYYLAHYFPAGSTLLSASSSVAGIETLAARAPGSNNVHVLVVNRQMASQSAVGGPGLPATVHVKVGNLGGITQVSIRQLDNETPLTSGPPAATLPVGNSATVHFAGYGAALLDFVTTSPAVSPPALTRTTEPAASAGFADGFESGNLAAWSATTGTGSAVIQTGFARTGSRGLTLSNAGGQAVWLTKDLGRPLESSSTSFYLRPTGTTAGFVAWGRDATSMKARWGLVYVPGDHSLTYLVYDDGGVATALRSGSGTVPLDAWTKVELRYVGTTDGGAELLLDDVSRASVKGDYSSASPYRLLQLANETAASTTSFDEVEVVVR